MTGNVGEDFLDTFRRVGLASGGRHRWPTPLGTDLDLTRAKSRGTGWARGDRRRCNRGDIDGLFRNYNQDWWLVSIRYALTIARL